MKETIIKTASESTRTPEVNAQPSNRTEQKELTLDEREVRIKEKVIIKAICRQCQTEIPQLLNRGLTLVDSETILANHECQKQKEPIILLDEFEKKAKEFESENPELAKKINSIIGFTEIKKGLINQIESKSNLTKIQGILTSNLRSRASSNTPYMAFLRLETADFTNHSLAECQAKKCQECEIPVVFRLKETGLIFQDEDTRLEIKPSLKKGDRIILEGKWANSKDSNRPSFTCYSYQVLGGNK